MAYVQNIEKAIYSLLILFNDIQSKIAVLTNQLNTAHIDEQEKKQIKHPIPHYPWLRPIQRRSKLVLEKTWTKSKLVDEFIIHNQDFQESKKYITENFTENELISLIMMTKVTTY